MQQSRNIHSNPYIPTIQINNEKKRENKGEKAGRVFTKSQETLRWRFFLIQLKLSQTKTASSQITVGKD